MKVVLGNSNSVLLGDVYSEISAGDVLETAAGIST